MFARSWTMSPAGVGDGALELLDDRVGLLEQVDRTRRPERPPWSTSCASGSWRSPMRAPTSGNADLGNDERLAEAGVEALRDVAHELDVLALVLPHRNLVRAVGEHVRGLEHRVEEQPCGDQLPLRGGLVAELVHAVEPAELGRQPPSSRRQLGVLGDVGLPEEDAAPGVEAGGEQDGRRVVDHRAQLRPGRTRRSARAGRPRSRSPGHRGPGPRRTARSLR